MSDRFIVFDVETPNSKNNRMSSIGITVIENTKIKENFCYLVNPDTYFDRFNINLTGITPEMVESEKNFGQLWKELKPIMDSGLKIAHFAPFDMGVLSKCISAYLPGETCDMHYACTCAMGKKLLPSLPNHRLNTLCDFLGIPLDHHNAQSDSLACANILLYYLERGADINTFIRTYNKTNRSKRINYHI